MKRECWFNGKRVTPLRFIESVSFEDKTMKNYLMCKTKCGGTILIEDKVVKELVPTQLINGDRVMFISNGKLHGVTEIKNIENECAILSMVPSYVHFDFIPRNIKENGLIVSSDNFDIYLYEPVICKKLGFEYKDIKEMQIGETFYSRTSSGDLSKINVRRRNIDEGDVCCYTVTIDVVTSDPEGYGFDYACISNIENGMYLMRNQITLQSKTWKKILEKINNMKEGKE